MTWLNEEKGCKREMEAKMDLKGRILKKHLGMKGCCWENQRSLRAETGGVIGSKSFYYYFSSKIINKENTGPLLSEAVTNTQCFFCLSSLKCSPRVKGAEEIPGVEQD